MVTFVVYATYGLALGVFVFWFGVWMLHLIAIIYGKIRLHKKSRLYQKLHQHNLLQPRSRTTSSCNKSGSHYDDLLGPSNIYHQLHHHIADPERQHGPTPLTTTTSLVVGGPGQGFFNHLSIHNKNCDFSSLIEGGGGRNVGEEVDDDSSGGAGDGRETIINLSCEDTLHSNGSPTSTSSGISSSTSSPEVAPISSSGPGLLIPSPLKSATTCAENNHENASRSGDPLLRKTAAEIANRLPKVSILKPLMGLDTNLAANLETFFTMDYPRQSYEILFCVESEEDPVLGLCQSLIEKYKGEVDARLFIGGEQVGVNPKINNMEPGYRESKYELIMISDAGIKMKPDTLIDMVEHMTEKVALVHQMPFTCDREGFAATYEKIFFGTIQSRIYLVSDCLNVICHTGMSCLIRKKVLEKLGGLKAFGCYLAEDFFMAKSIMEDGWKTTISSYPALQNSGVCDVKTFQNRLVRWAKLRIAMISYLILLEPMSECMIVGLMASWGVSILFRWDGLAFYLIHILCWFLSDWMLLTIVQNGSVSFNKFDFVVGWLFREISGPYLFFCALWNPAIRWRTRVYKLDWGGVANEISTSSKIKT